jgi:hypothetical protein
VFCTPLGITKVSSSVLFDIPRFASFAPPDRPRPYNACSALVRSYYWEFFHDMGKQPFTHIATRNGRGVGCERLLSITGLEGSPTQSLISTVQSTLLITSSNCIGDCYTSPYCMFSNRACHAAVRCWGVLTNSDRFEFVGIPGGI